MVAQLRCPGAPPLLVATTHLESPMGPNHVHTAEREVQVGAGAGPAGLHAGQDGHKAVRH
jgi:hypothetical protein